MENTKPTYLGRIFIDNFLCFDGENILPLIDENEKLYQWTIILGNNNTGKTNLLKAIADLEPLPHKSKIEVEERRITANFFRHRYTINPPRREFILGSTYISCDIFFANNNEEQALSKKTLTPYISEFYNADDTYGRWGYSPYFSNALEKSSILGALQIYSYGVTRKYNTKGNTEKDINSNSSTLFDADQKLINIEDWLFQLEFAAKNGQEENANKRIDLIKKIVISELFPDINDFRFVTSDKLKNTIEFETEDGWFELDELGYGYQTTLSWIIDLCKKMFERYPDSDNPLKEPAIVLIDELDLHLHPKWQKNIVNYLTQNFTSTQFIATTHSPLIIQTIDNANVFLLKKENKKTTIEQLKIKSYEGWSVEEILKDVMDVKETRNEYYLELLEDFNKALDNENIDEAISKYALLDKILHPENSLRKVLKIQLTGLGKHD